MRTFRFARAAMLAAAVTGALVGSASAGTSAGNWTVDHARSRLGFAASMSGTVFEGTFAAWTAAISFDPADLATAKAVVTIDMNSATTDNATRDAALPGSDWFDVANHAVATFETTTFSATGENAYAAVGTLTMRGIAQPITLPFTLVIDNGHATMNARLAINRTNWGVGQGAFTTDDPVVISVEVIVSVVATAAP